jgi:hypothetical protein
MRKSSSVRMGPECRMDAPGRAEAAPVVVREGAPPPACPAILQTAMAEFRCQSKEWPEPHEHFDVNPASGRVMVRWGRDGLTSVDGREAADVLSQQTREAEALNEMRAADGLPPVPIIRVPRGGQNAKGG